MTVMAVALERAGANEKLAHLTLRSFTITSLQRTGLDATRVTRLLTVEMASRLGLPVNIHAPWLDELCKSYVYECLRDMDKKVAVATSIGGANSASRLTSVPPTIRHREAIKKTVAKVSRDLFLTEKTSDNQLWCEVSSDNMLCFIRDAGLALLLWNKFVKKRVAANPRLRGEPLKKIITSEEFAECLRESRSNWRNSVVDLVTV